MAKSMSLRSRGAKKVVYEDWIEDCEQGRYFYGTVDCDDKVCSFCRGVIEWEHQGEAQCHLCGEYGDYVTYSDY